MPMRTSAATQTLACPHPPSGARAGCCSAPHRAGGAFCPPPFALFAAILLLFSVPASAAEETEPAIRFVTVDLFIDSGAEALAAYQAEIRYPSERVRIVGVEGGEEKGFKDAPHFDPNGRRGGRMVLAAYVKDDADAPEGETRVARLHLRVKDAGSQRVTVKLVVAAAPGGKKIAARARIVAPAPKKKGQDA